jgi:hypothetical protein
MHHLVAGWPMQGGVRAGSQLAPKPLRSLQQLLQQPVVKRYGAAADEVDEVLSEDASIDDEF